MGPVKMSLEVVRKIIQEQVTNKRVDRDLCCLLCNTAASRITTRSTTPPSEPLTMAGILAVLEVEPLEVPLLAERERVCKERCNGYRVSLGDFIWVSPAFKLRWDCCSHYPD